MIFVLDATNKALKFTVSAGTDVHFTSHWADATTSGLTEGQTQGTSNGSTAVDAVAAPAASTRRVVKLITFHNTNTTTSRTVTLVNDVGGTSRTIAVFTLAPLATWYSDTAATTAIADGDKGDITVSGSGATWTIDNDAVTTAKVFNDAITYAKIQNISATSRVLGRKSSGSGDTEECTLSEVLDFVGSAAQGDILYRDASSWTRLGAGTRGRYLQTAGASANPAWANDVNFKNLLINGDMSISQRNGTTNTSISDDVYALDRWYVLTQTAAIQVQQQSNQENGTPFNSRLTQNQATAQRMGYAQIIEGKNCRHLRGQQVTLSFRVRCSSSQAIRYAILEWTGTEDAVTSDVVNSWTSATYSTGNFFISTTTTIPSNGVTSTTPSANTWTDVTPLTVTLGSSFNNLTVFIWTEGTAANSVTLDISRVQLEPGPVATEFEYLPIDIVINRCLRYFYRCDISGNNGNFLSGVGSTGSGNQAVRCAMSFIVPMRAAPTASFQNAQVYNGTSVFTINSIGGQYSSRYIASLDLNISGNPGSGTQCQVIENSSAGRFDYDIEL